MSLYIKQVCDACENTRSLLPKDVSRHELGGWRTLQAGSKQVTLCNDCVSVIVTHVNKRVALRHAEGVDEANRISNLRNFSLTFLEYDNKDYSYE